MLTKKEREEFSYQAIKALEQAGIVLSEHEKYSLELTDFGLSRFEEIGLAIVVYVNTERVCAKELVLLPGQTCPEHRHPPFDGEPGKEETFRCRRGMVHLFTPGPPTNGSISSPKSADRSFTVWHETILRPGDQATVMPDTLHWFRAGSEGAIVSEFSTQSRDELDVFSDIEVRRGGH